MTGKERIQKILIVAACTLAAFLVCVPRPSRHSSVRENVVPADSILRCYVTMDGSTKGTKGINGGMSAFLMRKYAQETRTPTKVVFSGFEAIDCLRCGSADIVAVMMSDSIPSEGIYASREIGDSIIWLIRADEPGQLLSLDAWITDIVSEGDYPKLKKDFLRVRQTGNQISPFDDIIKRYAKQNGWDWRLVAAVIRHESRFKISVVSPRGAIGLMQIIPYRYSAEQLFSPDYNVMAGTEHMSRMRKMFKPYSKDSVQNVKFTLAAYNAGEGRLLECIRFAKSIGVDATSWDSIAVRALPRMRTFSGKQTTAYVDSIIRTYHRYQLRYAD